MCDLTLLFGVGRTFEEGDESIGMGYLGEACALRPERMPNPQDEA